MHAGSETLLVCNPPQQATQLRALCRGERGAQCVFVLARRTPDCLQDVPSGRREVERIAPPIVPVFEELLFRGVLPGWLRTHLSSSATLVAAAALFALMHGYPIAMPAAFVFGLVAGWVRQVTGSTLNTVVIHVLNNVAMLLSGLLLLK